ncbi:uncharacterized protein LOC126766014 [Bactrocera neohumeralis]|uniref:uncharacterized protein LOC120767686 n=1 Tax=Bactrocera tryoni TaxID=59916 RepID=UPI001A95659C|nr:uncharacterized protein LOC120767686 [Bactrocera tryoni]XP_039969221.1 uncharacterized protein LOC120781156 [Bactrocera tryoni]XP_050339685.1 uncharacterized protein LOC126766014 [Bactrocera neohumeralis]
MSLNDSLAVTAGPSHGEFNATTPIFPRIPLPLMSEDNIEAYFYSLDFWFEASGVTTDSAKFNIVAASIPQVKLMELRSIIDAAPTSARYQFIRTKLIENFTESQQRRLQRVLRDMPLGDRRPSDLFNEMKRAAGSALSESILHDLWVNRLPQYAQAAIIATNVPIVDKLKIADSIVETMQMREVRIHEVSASNHTTDNDLRTEIAELKQRFDRVTSSEKTRARFRSKTPVRPHNINSGEMCWYHAKFGPNAKKCRQPCKFVQSTSPNGKQ